MIDLTTKYGQLRYIKPKIWERDKGICQRCGKKWIEKERLFPMHHINGDNSNNNPTNLILVCGKCHSWLWVESSNPNSYVIARMNELIDKVKDIPILTKYCRETNGLCPKGRECPLELYKFELLRGFDELPITCPIPIK